jgi:PAS domain S-box-containing protein
MVVGSDGRVAAVSEAAEEILGAEQGLLGKSVDALLSSKSEDLLERRLARAAAGANEVVDVPVQANGARRDGALRARISSCSSPRAALLVIEPAGS